MRSLFAVLFILVCSLAASGEHITERQAVERFLAASPEVRLLDLERQLALADARMAGRPPDGEIGFSRESAGGQWDLFLTYSHPLPITGRRTMLRQSAELAASAQSFRLDLIRHNLRVDLRQAFLRVLLIQEKIIAAQEARGRLAELVEALHLREQGGDISAYDRMRAERELSLVHTVEGGFRGMLAGAQADLAIFLSPDTVAADLVAAGELNLPRLPDLDGLFDRAAGRPDLQAIRREMDSLDVQEKAARRKAYPEPIVGGGLKSSSFGGDRDNGYIFSITVPLPIFDRGDREAARAAVARQAARMRADVLQLRIQRQLRGAWQESRVRVENAERFHQETLAQTKDLVRMAQVAYDAGEAGILELMDAWNTDFESHLRALELLAEARRAALELERWVGEEVIQ